MTGPGWGFVAFEYIALQLRTDVGDERISFTEQLNRVLWSSSSERCARERRGRKRGVSIRGLRSVAIGQGNLVHPLPFVRSPFWDVP